MESSGGGGATGPAGPDGPEGPAGAAAEFIAFTAALGHPGSVRKSATISAAGCTPSGDVTILWGALDETEENSPETCAVQFSVTPGTDDFQLVVSSERFEKIGGNFQLKYALT